MYVKGFAKILDISKYSCSISKFILR